MSMENILAAAAASGCLAVLRESHPPAAPVKAAVPAPTPRAEPPKPREPIDLAALSIAPTNTAEDWRPPPRPASARPPPAPSGPIDLASLSIAPTDTAKPGRRRKRRQLARHEDLYVISREELADRLAARRERRRTPSRKRGELTNLHRIAMAMEPGRWYTSGALEHFADLPQNVISSVITRMRRWPLLHLERVERPDREPPFFVPAPYGRGGRTLRQTAQWIYRLTESGKELRLEGLDIAAKDGAAT
jgi:hypothetical protein